MSRMLYLDCCFGISGDMTVAALIELGVDKSKLINDINTLGLDGYEIIISDVFKSGVKACDFNIHMTNNDNYDSNMDYLHNINSNHSEAEHFHTHRTYEDIRQIIINSKIGEKAKNISLEIFSVLARAEAKAHNMDIDKVSFHEVGAIDSIIDIVAVALCIEQLDIDNVIITGLCDGHGFVRCRHGVIPIPVPAVVNIVADSDLKLSVCDVEGELVTPTGAAIASVLKTHNTLPDCFEILKVGTGAGKRNYKLPSMLRAMIISCDDSDSICKLEANIDDTTGEAFGYAMQRLLENGALDVCFLPLYMKKNRPSYRIEVLCKKSDVKNMELLIFKHTTTIGIRKSSVERTVLERKIICVSTKYGDINVKKCTLPDGSHKFYPEYESIKRICDESNASFDDVYYEAVIESENRS